MRVDRYLRALGIPVLESEAAFDKHTAKLHKQHGAAWERVGEIINARASGDLSADIYTAKNANLDLSLGVQALAVGVYRGLLSQIRGFTPAPNAILDVGCENGVVACYLALLYPNARVVGVGHSVPAIDRARELARVLGIKSANFYVGTAANIDGLGGRDFDIAFALTVYQDAGFIPDHGDQGHRVGFQSPNPIHPLPELEALRAVMATTGFWMSVERCRCPTDLAWWLETINASGWEIDWENSRQIDCSLKGEADELSLTVAKPRARAGVPIDPSMIQAVWLSARFARRIEKVGGDAWLFRDEGARAFREAIQVEKVLRRARTEEGAQEYIEVGTTGPFAFFFGENSGGMAVMRWTVLTQLEQLFDEWQRTLDEMRKRLGEHAVKVELPPPFQ